MSASTLDYYGIASFELMRSEKLTDPSSTAKDFLVTRDVSEYRYTSA
jgi:hypothetical protein